MIMLTKERYIERENERAKRLLEFVKGELRAMYVESRFRFTIDVFNYLMPELEELKRKGELPEVK